MSPQEPSPSPDPLGPIKETRHQLQTLLRQQVPDAASINGVLNFAGGRALNLILKDIHSVLGLHDNGPDNNGSRLASEQGDQQDKELAAESVVDRIWADFYRPVFRYYQGQHQMLIQHAQRTRRRTPVELRKLNDKFLKSCKISRDFFFGILRQLMGHYNLGGLIPKNFYDFLNIEMDDHALVVSKKNPQALVKIVYVCHRCMLFIGTTSRYRSTLSQMISPEKSQEDFHQALGMSHYAELLLPSFGEARNTIGMIYNSRNMDLLALYEFMRSVKAKITCQSGLKNFEALIRNTQPVVDNLNRLRIENNPNRKTRMDYISTYFFALFGFYILPASWMRTEGILINGTKVEELSSDFFKLVSIMAFDGEDTFLFEKILLLLVGGISMLDTRGDDLSSVAISEQCKSMLKFTITYVVHIMDLFVDFWGKNTNKSLKLLPFLRIVFSWLKQSSIGVHYCHRNLHFLISKRPKRVQYFKEDVGVREYEPIDKYLRDFDDEHIFESDDFQCRVIGLFAEHDESEENLLRLRAVAYLCKKILMSRPNGVSYDAEAREIKIDQKIIEKFVRNKEKMDNAAKIRASTPQSNNKKPQKSTKAITAKREIPGLPKTPKTADTKKQVQKKFTNKASRSSDTSSEGSVESLSEEVFNRAKFEAMKISDKRQENISPVDHEDQRLVNATSMVNALVDDNFIQGSATIAAGCRAAADAGKLTRNHSEFQGAFAMNGNGYSGFVNPAFPSYPNYPIYPAVPQQALQPQPQVQQALLQPNPYEQYAGIYGYGQSPMQQQQSQPPQQQYSPYGIYQPIVQVPETPSQPTPHNKQAYATQFYPYGSM